MAINKWGSAVLHSLYGRKFGLDSGDYVVGIPGVRNAYEASTAGSTLTAYGFSVLSGSTDAWTLPGPPAIGVEKSISNNSSLSTAIMKIVRSTTDVSFTGSTANGGGGVAISLTNSGAGVTLIGISTTVWAIKATATLGTTPMVAVSTSS